MVNVTHASLTGSNLHEPKGIATATAGQVYISNGSGGGVWTSLGAAQNPFGAALFHIVDVENTSQTLLANVWTTRRLVTLLSNEIVSASHASNTITLPAGTYWVNANASWLIQSSLDGTYESELRLHNISTGNTLLNGTSLIEIFPVTTAQHITSGILFVNGRFTLGSTATIALQQYSTNFITAGGHATGDKVLAEVMLWKIS